MIHWKNRKKRTTGEKIRQKRLYLTLMKHWLIRLIITQKRGSKRSKVRQRRNFYEVRRQIGKGGDQFLIEIPALFKQNQTFFGFSGGTSQLFQKLECVIIFYNCIEPIQSFENAYFNLEPVNSLIISI